MATSGFAVLIESHGEPSLEPFDSGSRLIYAGSPSEDGGASCATAEIRNRTGHLRITSAPLCQMSYLGLRK